MIAAEAVTVARAGRRLVDAVTLQAAASSVTAVIGPNGAGKSTLMKVLSGEILPDAGRVTLDGRPLGGLTPRERARRRAVLPQSATVAFPFTVAEVVQLGLSVPAFRIGRAEQAAIVAQALAAVDLTALAGRAHDRLSGGERQRCHLARVLAQLWGGTRETGRPGLLLLDEPTAAQDIAHQLLVAEIAREHAREGGATIMVLHDLNLAARAADRIAVVAAGRLAALGPPAEVVTESMLAKAFHVALVPTTPPAAGVPYVLPQSATRL